MRITPDTNILVRAYIKDDPQQAEAAARLLREAELVAVSIPCLCEFVWVLRRAYKLSHEEVSLAIRDLVNAGNVAVDHPTVKAGLKMLDLGGDFADGIMADAGRWLGGTTFISYDRKAVKLLQAQGHTATLLS